MKTEAEKLQRLQRNAYMREWKRKNREKVNEINRNVKSKRPDHYREINRISAAKARALDPEKFVAKNRMYRDRNPEQYLLNHARSRANVTGVEFDLTLEDISIPEKCPVMGYFLEWGEGQKASSNWFSPSLDRTNPDKGYVKGNVRVISNRANHLKNNGTLEEFRLLVTYLERLAKCPFAT